MEINELIEELDSIATTTQFNTRNLLDGSLQEGAAREDSVGAIESNARIGDTAFADMLSGLTIDGDVEQDAAYQFTILQGDGCTKLRRWSWRGRRR